MSWHQDLRGNADLRGNGDGRTDAQLITCSDWNGGLGSVPHFPSCDGAIELDF